MNITQSTQTELARREIQTHLLDLVEELKAARSLNSRERQVAAST